ncbi:MAG TPA: helix-turn-helix transcriptional regulator [Polyangiaceae bacterium]|jgi:transcriptional regulator with XRE-family HTH domain
MRRTRKTPRTRPETHDFRVALMVFRQQQEWTQERFAIRLGVSRRTYLNWENGYWLPPEREQLHLVMVVAEASPMAALEIAERLGLTADRTAAPALLSLRAAVESEKNPPPPRPTPEALRAALDGAVREEAERLNVTASAFRQSVARVLGLTSGATLGDVVAAIGAR